MHAISRRVALLALAALTLVTACGDDDEPSGTSGAITGRYNLRTVNTQTLPMTVYEGNAPGFPYKVEVLAGHVTLNANGSFEDITTIRETANNGTPTPRDLATTGTYVRNGNTLTFTDQANDTYTLTVQSDGSLVQTADLGGIPITARYVKQ